MAGGDRSIEAFGGAVVLVRRQSDGSVRYWAIRPLISREERPAEETFWWFLPPLGTQRVRPEERVLQFLPVMRYAAQYPEGQPSTWTLLALPGIYWAKTNDDRIVRAWFPFGGIVEEFLSFDRAWFVLFPLYTHIERAGRTTRHVLWPFFTISTGEGGPAGRVWPLLGVNRWEGRYERWFFLWPFFHWQKGDQGLREELHSESWMVWPLYGRRKRGASRSWTALWPFFGRTTNPEKDFWAWDGPWPFVRLQEPGTSGQARRWRFWPFYSFYEGDGLTSRWILWPLFNRRLERYPDATKKTTYLFPFWHSWDRTDRGKGDSEWRKLFPVFRYARREEGNGFFFAFPALNPLWRLQFVDEHYAWMWELYSVRRFEDQVRERSWLGLWRREKDRDEDRRSLVGLWARRDYALEGRDVTETSLLFGLLRWRTTEKGRSLLRPAIPGPGWPLKRTVRTLPQEAPSGGTGRPR